MGSENRKIAKNTLSLYFRMFITLGVSLYTSRIVLNVLGVSDYGLYSLVGGIVTLMGFLNSTMAASTQRYLNYESGKKNPDRRLREVFGTSQFIHLLMAAIILLIAETIGLWFLNSHVNIEAGRVAAANWIYQCSVLTFIISILSVPYNAAIIANEKMSAFAYISIFDVVLKLLAVFCLELFQGDKLIIYGVFMLLISLAVRSVYSLYARRNFPECRIGPKPDMGIFKEMISFSAWTVMSHLSVVLRLQGVSVLLNIFFGSVLNATQGIANQVNSAVNGFVLNFTQALNPQIVKSYAAGEIGRTRSLVMYGCRLSFFLLLFFCLPILLEADIILKIWLKDVPSYTSVFVRLVLIQSLVESFSGVLSTAQAATGKVKTYHMTLSSIGLMNLPLSFLFLVNNFEPYTVVYVAIILSLTISIVRLLFLKKSIKLSLKEFATSVVLRCLIVSGFSLLIPVYLHYRLPTNLPNSLAICIAAFLSVLITVFALGLAKNERLALSKEILKKFGKKNF